MVRLRTPATRREGAYELAREALRKPGDTADEIEELPKRVSQPSENNNTLK